MSASDISNKVWGYAKVLLDDGVSYNDYVEQLTYLIFLKMADERQQAGQADNVPKEWSWRKLVKLDGTDLEIQRCQPAVMPVLLCNGWFPASNL